MTANTPESPDSVGDDANPVFLAPEDAASQRLDKWLADQPLGISRSRLRALIEEGRVSKDGQPITDASAKVIPGAAYAIDLPPPAEAEPQPENIPLDVVYEDEHLIVIDKPAGMVAHPAAGSESGTLVNALLYHCGASLTGVGGVARPGIVHRLDKDTTGVMVAAKTDKAHGGLTALFAAHDIERAYLAVTRGSPRPLIGRIEARIARSPNDRKKMGVVRQSLYKHDPYADDPMLQQGDTDHGREAITNYRVLKTFGRLDATGTQPAAALVECRLETGRTHQIRVHLAHIGAPVMGDQVYGKHRWLKADGKGPAFERAKEVAKAFDRQALHAAVLGFVHPVTGKQLRFERPPHADMAELIEVLGKM